jgi:hypothetical protein
MRGLIVRKGFAAARSLVGRPFMLDEKLSRDERIIRDTGRAHACETLLLSVTAPTLKNKVDRDVLHEMEELGLTGITLRETFGCANVHYVDHDERHGARYAYPYPRDLRRPGLRVTVMRLDNRLLGQGC